MAKNAYEKAFALDAHIKSQRQRFELSTETRQDAAKRLSDELGFKVSTGMLKAAFENNGICRLTKQEREIKAIRDEVEALRSIVVKLATANCIPDWLREEVVNTAVINEEIKEVLRKRRTA